MEWAGALKVRENLDSMKIRNDQSNVNFWPRKGQQSRKKVGQCGPKVFLGWWGRVRGKYWTRCCQIHSTGSEGKLSYGSHFTCLPSRSLMHHHLFFAINSIISSKGVNNRRRIDKKLCLRRSISSSLSKDILPMIMINYHHGDDDVDQRKFVKTNWREQQFPEFSFFIKQAMMMMMTLTRLKVVGINTNEQTPKW